MELKEMIKVMQHFADCGEFEHYEKVKLIKTYEVELWKLNY